jgi:hypothetical protein
VCGLPAQIHRIADAGIRALPAGGTVNMSGIPKKKRAAGPEPVFNAVMDAVGRKPIHLRHSYVQQLLDPATDILKSQIGALRQPAAQGRSAAACR